jgi:hypothetical protein
VLASGPEDQPTTPLSADRPTLATPDALQPAKQVLGVGGGTPTNPNPLQSQPRDDRQAGRPDRCGQRLWVWQDVPLPGETSGAGRHP